MENPPNIAKTAPIDKTEPQHNKYHACRTTSKELLAKLLVLL